MANVVRIELKKEIDLTVKGDKIVPIDGPIGNNVYASCDELQCWIGSCTDINSLEEIAGPEELISSIQESASEYELIALMSALNCNDNKYIFFDEIRTAKKVR